VKKLKPQEADWARIEHFLQSAERKLASARKILAFDEEACLQQAHEATSTLISYSGGQEGGIGANTDAASNINPYPHPTYRGCGNVGRDSEPSTHRRRGEEFAVSSDGMEMFGVLDLETTFEGCRFAVGIIRQEFPREGRLTRAIRSRNNVNTRTHDGPHKLLSNHTVVMKQVCSPFVSVGLDENTIESNAPP
jgi:hypothetical protein